MIVVNHTSHIVPTNTTKQCRIEAPMGSHVAFWIDDYLTGLDVSSALSLNDYHAMYHAGLNININEFQCTTSTWVIDELWNCVLINEFQYIRAYVWLSVNCI